MDGFDFQARAALGIVTGRFSHAPGSAEVRGFVEKGDSARLDLRVGCPGCVLDAHSGDVVILSYPRSEKPLAAFVNGRAVDIGSGIVPFEERSECIEAG